MALGICLLWTVKSSAQAPTATPANGDTSKVQIIFSQSLRASNGTKFLRGSVHLRRREVDFFCDSAVVFPDNFVKAIGNVHIIQNDTINIYGDSLHYYGAEKKSKLFGNASLSDGQATLFTEILNYDHEKKIGTYDTDGIISNDSTVLNSKEGRYEVDSSMAYFYKDVELEGPDMNLKSQKLAYNTKQKRAIFIAPTDIYLPKRKKKIYTEGGYYDSKQKFGRFDLNPRYQGEKDTAYAKLMTYDGEREFYVLEGDAYFADSAKAVNAQRIEYDAKRKKYSFMGSPKFRDKGGKGQRIDADESDIDDEKGIMIFRRNVMVSDSARQLKTDSLYYNKKTKEGAARGHVVIQDTISNYTLISEYADFNDSTGYVFATQNPLFINKIEDDSLYMRADTLITFKKNPKDSIRHIQAFHHVRFFKSNFQGRSDSLYYDGADSIFWFYGKPILWADTTQFTGDTIRMKMRNKKMDNLFLFNRSFIVNNPDTIFYNQIAGFDCTVRFKDNKLDDMTMEKEGESVYYLQNEQKAFSGVNKTICERMLLYFKENKVDRIKFYTKPKAVLYPMRQVNHKTLKLDGFLWRPELRPTKMQDLIEIVNYKL